MQNIQFKKDKCNVLYLIDKNSYITKMSRVRFHAIKKLGEIANVIYWGQNWNNYDDNLTLDENITRNLNFHIDYIIAYKPQSIKNFKNCKIPKTISFNEMWDEKITLTEINAVQPDLIVCHHDNDRVRYQTVLKKNIECYTKLVHIGHCAENSIFYDKKEDRPIDILLCGTVGRHYPLRQRLQKIIKIMPKKYNCMEYKHPGYINGDSFTNIYLKDFADGINKAKICITCTSKYFYRLGKMVEIPMAGSVLACDLPDQDQEVFKQIMIVINPSDTDEQIINQLVHYLENPNKLEEIRLRGLEWSKKYVQNTYANSILENMKVLNKSPKIFVLADELKDLKSKWICDVLKEEFIKYSNLNIVTNSSDADIIWLMAPWATRKINMKHLQDKFVITTVHHVDWEKYEESKDYYKMIDSITNRYHTICPKTCESFKKLTTKKIDVANFWINENNFFKMNNKKELRLKYNLPEDAFIVGSFQKDTEGKDDMLPKLSKGPDIFVSIIKDMKINNPNIFVLLTGWRRNYVMRELDKIGIKYKFFELVDIVEINELYNCLDLYIVSSRVEGGPRSIIECGLNKTPLISTDVGIAEYILNKSSIYDSNDFMTYKKAKENIKFAYNNALSFSIGNYMKKFINNVFYEINI